MVDMLSGKKVLTSGGQKGPLFLGARCGRTRRTPLRAGRDFTSFEMKQVLKPRTHQRTSDLMITKCF
jgi:hypothetical protein